MPKLLVFAPCQRVLFDQDNNISLISIFQELRVPAVENIPAHAQALIRWEVVALWGRVPDDEGRTFEQDTLLIAPDGSLAAHTKQQFSVSAPLHRNVATMHGFPVTQAGEYSLVVKLKDMQDKTAFVLESLFPMRVIHQAKPETPAP